MSFFVKGLWPPKNQTINQRIKENQNCQKHCIVVRGEAAESIFCASRPARPISPLLFALFVLSEALGSISGDSYPLPPRPLTTMQTNLTIILGDPGEFLPAARNLSFEGSSVVGAP